MDYEYSQILNCLENVSSGDGPPLVRIAAQKAVLELRDTAIAIARPKLGLELGHIGSPAIEHFDSRQKIQSREIARSIALPRGEYASCRPLFIAKDAIGFYTKDGALLGCAKVDPAALNSPNPVSVRRVERLIEALANVRIMEEVAPGTTALEWLKVARALASISDALWPGNTVEERAAKLATFDGVNLGNIINLLQVGEEYRGARAHHTNATSRMRNAHQG